jgi:hypothetical protein
MSLCANPPSRPTDVDPRVLERADIDQHPDRLAGVENERTLPAGAWRRAATFRGDV